MFCTSIYNSKLTKVLLPCIMSRNYTVEYCTWCADAPEKCTIVRAWKGANGKTCCSYSSTIYIRNNQQQYSIIDGYIIRMFFCCVIFYYFNNNIEASCTMPFFLQTVIWQCVLVPSTCIVAVLETSISIFAQFASRVARPCCRANIRLTRLSLGLCISLQRP